MKTAVVLLNLGGPDSRSAIKPFLRNLFKDKAIIGLPQPLRSLVGNFIAGKRLKKAQWIYEKMGNKSPLLEFTQRQAIALEHELAGKGEYKVFISMRYWHPRAADVVRKVKAWQPDKVVLLPLYPQFSTTTTQSSFDEWYAQAARHGLSAPHHPVCCYPFDNHFIDAHAQLIKPVFQEALKHGKPRILFCAHGLPLKIIKRGDPYQWQVERTASAILRKLGPVDYAVCYQSRVGPLKWLRPSMEEEILRAAHEQVPLVVVPVSFVSEHSETLVDLDIESRALANKNHVPYFGRVPALSAQDNFIKSLAWLVESTQMTPNCSNALGRQCPTQFEKCGYREWKRA